MEPQINTDEEEMQPRSKQSTWIDPFLANASASGETGGSGNRSGENHTAVGITLRGDGETRVAIDRRPSAVPRTVVCGTAVASLTWGCSTYKARRQTRRRNHRENQLTAEDAENSSEKKFFFSHRWRKGMPFRVKEVLQTPNPNAKKFVLDGRICEGAASFFNAEAGRDHPVAKRLFEIPGVSSLLLLGDFVTVNKRPEAKWAGITGKVKQVLGKV